VTSLNHQNNSTLSSRETVGKARFSAEQEAIHEIHQAVFAAKELRLTKTI
jgi:hypothetical protein